MILPPRNLYHPVLPVKVKMDKHEKLLLPLCLECAVKKYRKCHNTEDERIITGTLSTIEVHKAIEKGYMIEEIYEIGILKRKVINYLKDI